MEILKSLPDCIGQASGRPSTKAAGRWLAALGSLLVMLVTFTGCSMIGEGLSSGASSTPSIVQSIAAPEKPSLPTTASTTEPTPLPTFELPALATGAVDTTDFDAVYRHLDSVRVEAWYEEDPEKMAKVSSNKRKIARIQEELDDTKTRIDYHGSTYVVELVEVFWVIDENNVLLRVEDTHTGQWRRVDSEGNVVKEFAGRSSPLGVFVVWMERTESGPWLIAEDYLVSSDFPDNPEDFVELETVRFDRSLATLYSFDYSTGSCLLLVVEGSIPVPECIERSEQDDDGLLGHYILDRAEVFEAAFFVEFDEDIDVGYLVDGGAPNPIDLKAEYGRQVGWWIDKPDVVGKINFQSPNPDVIVAPIEFNIDEARQSRRDYFAGLKN